MIIQRREERPSVLREPSANWLKHCVRPRLSSLTIWKRVEANWLNIHTSMRGLCHQTFIHLYLDKLRDLGTL